MAKRAKCIFRFTIQGNGRNETLTKQPLGPNADFSQSTDGNVSLNSPALLGQFTFQPGWNQVIDPATYLLSPMQRNFLLMWLPGFTLNGQTIPPSMTLAGSTLDGGVGITPAAPIVLGLPAGVGPVYIYNSGSYPITYDTWTW
jgi:hypothetical protein